jgi:hypothetical protein
MPMSAIDQGRSSSRRRATRNKTGSGRLLKTVYLCVIAVATFGWLSLLLVRDGANRLKGERDAKDSSLSNKMGRALSVSKC